MENLENFLNCFSTVHYDGHFFSFFFFAWMSIFSKTMNQTLKIKWILPRMVTNCHPQVENRMINLFAAWEWTLQTNTMKSKIPHASNGRNDRFCKPKQKQKKRGSSCLQQNCSDWFFLCRNRIATKQKL